MALFVNRRERAPIKRLEAVLRDKRSQRENIAERLSVTETLIAEKRAAVQHLAISGAGDGELDQAERDVRASEDRGKTLEGALEQIADAITQGENELSEVIEQRDRDEVAGALEAMAEAIKQSHPKFSEAAQQLSQAISGSAASVPETEGLVNFLQGTRDQVASAVAMVDAELRLRARDVRAGAAGFTKRLAETKPPVKQLHFPREHVYALNALKWTENGTVKTCPAFAQVNLPVDLVQVALRDHHADFMHTARVQAIIGAYGAGQSWEPLPPDDPRLVDLDALSALNAASTDVTEPEMLDA